MVYAIIFWWNTNNILTYTTVVWPWSYIKGRKKELVLHHEIITNISFINHAMSNVILLKSMVNRWGMKLFSDDTSISTFINL